jgi:hypothetical protein
MTEHVATFAENALTPAQRDTMAGWLREDLQAAIQAHSIPAPTSDRADSAPGPSRQHRRTHSSLPRGTTESRHVNDRPSRQIREGGRD